MAFNLRLKKEGKKDILSGLVNLFGFSSEIRPSQNNGFDFEYVTYTTSMWPLNSYLFMCRQTHVG